MNVNERFELIKRNTEEIIGEDNLKKLLKEKKKPVVYWGTAPTGKPHVGYFLPALKIADLLKDSIIVIDPDSYILTGKSVGLIGPITDKVTVELSSKLLL